MEDTNKERAELKKFNWGAFGWGFIWVICNGTWKYYWPFFLIIVILGTLSLIISFLKPIVSILILLLSIYIGLKGNEWAYNGNIKWKTFEEFISIQKIWTLTYFCLFIVTLILAIIFTILKI